MKKIILSFSLILAFAFFFSACEKAAELSGTSGKTINQDRHSYDLQDRHSYDLQPAVYPMPASAYKIVGDTVLIKKGEVVYSSLVDSSFMDIEGTYYFPSGQWGGIHLRDGVKIRISDCHGNGAPSISNTIINENIDTEWTVDMVGYSKFNNSGFEWDYTVFWEDYRNADGELEAVGLTKTFHYRVVDSLD